MKITRSNIKEILVLSNELLTIIDAPDSFDDGTYHVYHNGHHYKALYSDEASSGFIEAFKMLGKGHQRITVTSNDWGHCINWGIDAEMETVESILKSALKMNMDISLEVIEAVDPWAPETDSEMSSTSSLASGVEFANGPGIGVFDGRVSGDALTDFIEEARKYGIFDDSHEEEDIQTDEKD